MAREAGLFLGGNLDDFVPSKEELVPGSLEGRMFFSVKRSLRDRMDEVQPFGEPLE
jgi:hypothetical protein